MLLGLLLHLPTQNNPTTPKIIKKPTIPQPLINLQQQSLTDKLHTTHITHPLQNTHHLTHTHTNALQTIHEPTTALKTIINTQIPNHQNIHLTQTPNHNPINLHQHHIATDHTNDHNAHNTVQTTHTQHQRATGLPTQTLLNNNHLQPLLHHPQTPIQHTINLQHHLLLLLPVLPTITNILNNPHNTLNILKHTPNNHQNKTIIIKHLLSLLLIPLSITPFIKIAPLVVHSHQHFQHEHNINPLPTPQISLTTSKKQHYITPPTTPNKIPILI